VPKVFKAKNKGRLQEYVQLLSLIVKLFNDGDNEVFLLLWELELITQPVFTF